MCIAAAVAYARGDATHARRALGADRGTDRAADPAAAHPAERATEGRASSSPIRFPAINLPLGDTSPLGLIVITVDTLRADYLSSYGHSRVLTANIDRLASGGVLFTQAIAQSTTTTPSHASLFTGLHLQDHNVYSNFEALGDAALTFPEILQAQSFATFAIVNMRHLNGDIGHLDQGIDHFVPSGNMRGARQTIDSFLDWLDARASAAAPVSTGSAAGTDADATAAAAAAAATKSASAATPTTPPRFFAWLHFADVHTPYHPPPPYNRLYYDGDERDPGNRSLARIWPFLPTHMSDHPFFNAWLEGITDLRWVLAQYQGAVTYVDDEIGRLLDALERRNLLHRTGIVFTSDHGESLGEHDMYFVHSGLYEATVRVPLILYLPGNGRQGVHVRDVVELIDVMPTVLEYFALPIPPHLRGRSLWPLIRGQVQTPRIALIEHAGRNLVALRSDRFKYIKHLRTNRIQPAYPFVEGKEELYDLLRDPYERSDIAARTPEVLQVFRRELDARRKAQQGLAVGRAQLTDETVEVLRALGYVQ